MTARVYVNDETNPIIKIEELEDKYEKKYLSSKWFFYKCEKCGEIKQKKYYKYTGENYGVPPNNCKCRECKFKETVIKRYGSTSVLRDNLYEGMMKKYGSTSTAQFIDYSKTDYAARTEKSRKTCIAKYGVDNPAKAQVVKDKMVKTNIERYGEVHACKLPEMRKKLSEIAKARPEFKSAAISHERHLANRLAEVEEKQLEWLDSNKFRGKFDKKANKAIKYTFKCKKCNFVFQDEFCIDQYGNSYPICPVCSPKSAVNGGRSKQEAELFYYIKDFYSGPVLENNRKVLAKNRELDIYLPELKLAIEFNGTFWHGYTKYNYEDGVDLEEFKADFLSKKDECENLGIRLVTIPESLYNEKRDQILNYLKTEIAESVVNDYIIKEIDYSLALPFLEANSIKNIYQNNIVKLFGVYSGDELCSIVVFEKDEVLGCTCYICRNVKLDEDELLNKIASEHFKEKFFHKIDLHFNNGERKIDADYYLYYNGKILDRGEFKSFEEFFEVSRTLLFDFGYDLKEYN